MSPASPSERPGPKRDRAGGSLEARSGTRVGDGPGTSSAEWSGTDRYRVLRELGRGGMGVVYEALDRERGQPVALKTLIDFDAAGLYRFKQEFRTLTDVVHPNLVRLHELVVGENERAFFTMELIEGTDFRRYVRPEGGPAGGDRSLVLTVPSSRAIEPVADSRERQTLAPPKSASALPCLADLDRLRRALRQLAEGVQALHSAGRIHRDLKPSNVMVASDGRVVVLDLGVATSLRRHGGQAAPEDGEMVGTATYMAPEQAFGETPTPAADWYSVGIMLYEALVGRPPFTGDAADVITRKNTVDVVAPSRSVPGVPPDLDALCVDLLQRDPDLRPSGLDVLHRLGRARGSRPPTSLAPPATRVSPLFGRDEQLGALREAFEGVTAGRSIIVRLGGESGMGKSAIAAHFLDGLAERGEALVLRGRAYERESLPYKAVDSVVDEVSRCLAQCEDEGDPVELPEGIGALVRVFPVLRRVPSLANVTPDASTEPRDLRNRAFDALRALFGELARRWTLVIYIDDAQWGDADSASLVLALIRPPDPPPFLLLMTYRSDEAAGSEFLTELREGCPEDVEQREVSIGPLRAEDARALALTLLEGSDEGAQRTARAVARESRGSPFLVQELARSNVASNQRAVGQTLVVLTLEEMVSQRLERLPEEARRMIELVAVGGRPLPVSVIARAAGVDEGVSETIALLGARRFARAGHRGNRDVVETAHDRIRETLVSLLPEHTLRERHGALARVLEDTPGADAEAIAVHWLGAGDEARAVRFAEDAAEQSIKKLAFDHAARLVRLALEHAPASSERVQGLRVRLAEALAAGGRYSESAQAYIEAAAAAPADQRLAFQSAAAQQLLTAGRLDEGEQMLYGVLAAVGIRAPRSQLAALFWLVVYRLWLVVLGLRVREREASEVSPTDRVRIDTLLSAAMGFAIVNFVVGACMTARHLIEALRRGDRTQVIRAASLEAANLSAAGGRETARERALVDLSMRWAERETDPADKVYPHGARGIALFQRGRWLEGSEELARSLAVPHYGIPGYSNVLLFGAYTQMFVGNLNESRRRVSKLLVEAQERGDRYTRVNLGTSIAQTMTLASDDPERGFRAAREALALWPQRGFFIQHWQAVAYGADLQLYVGDAPTAYRRMKELMPPLEKNFLLQSVFVRVMTWHILARVAIASIPSSPGERHALIKEARGLARKLEREADAWPKALAAQIRASIASVQNDRAAAIDELRLALARLESPDGIYGWMARHRLGLLLGGDEGRELVGAVVETMRAQGVRDPDRWLSAYLPGDWGRT